MPEYIKREAANKAVCELCGTSEGTFCVRCDRNPLQALPAADVVPVVHGRWKDAVQSCHDSPHVKCSVCGEYYWRYFNKFNFCPNCGAKMDGGQDDV